MPNECTDDLPGARTCVSAAPFKHSQSSFPAPGCGFGTSMGNGLRRTPESNVTPAIAGVRGKASGEGVSRCHPKRPKSGHPRTAVSQSLCRQAVCGAQWDGKAWFLVSMGSLSSSLHPLWEGQSPGKPVPSSAPLRGSDMWSSYEASGRPLREPHSGSEPQHGKRGGRAGNTQSQFLNPQDFQKIKNQSLSRQFTV